MRDPKDTEDRKAASVALSCAADLLNSAAILIELEEDHEAERFLATVRTALQKAQSIKDWHTFYTHLRTELDNHLREAVNVGEHLYPKRVMN